MRLSQPDGDFTEEFFEDWLYAKRTKDMYDRSWRYWQLFLTARKTLDSNFDPIPSDQLFKQYALWRLNDCRRKGKKINKASSINGEISAINSLLHNQGTGLHRLTEAVGTRHLITGIERWQTESLGYQKSQTRAMVDDILDPILLTVPSVMDRAILLTMKHGGLRSDNAVFNMNLHHLKVEDCWFMPSFDNFKHVMIVLPGSKTNQPRAFEPRELFCCCKKPGKSRITCPVHTLYDIYKHRRRDQKHPLFELPNGDPYTMDALSSLLKRCCKQHGLDPAYYTSKCLRIGCATDWYKRGKSLDWIMKEYNWKSRKTLRVYLRTKNPDLPKFTATKQSA